MDKDMMQQIHDIAARFRSAIESYKSKEYPSYIAMHFGFPRGSCGEASDLLGAYLIEQGFKDVRYVCGRRKRATHAWVEVDGIIVDITADQFEGEIFDKVIVSRNSDWHKKEWKLDHQREIIEIGWKGNFVDADRAIAYRMITKRMSETD